MAAGGGGGSEAIEEARAGGPGKGALPGRRPGPPFPGGAFGLREPLDHPRISGRVEPRPGRWTHHVVVGTPQELDGELLGWLRAAAEEVKR